jgi:hypothetical protein
MMFFDTIGMVAGHDAARHIHRRPWSRLIGMRQLHRTAVQNERKREDNGKQSFLQAKTHERSRAKS